MTRPRPAPRAFPLFGEMLLIGAMVALAAAAVVTALGAFAAGCGLLREFLEDDAPPDPRRFARLLRATLRDPLALLAPAGFAAVAALDALAWLAHMPGAVVAGPAAATVLLACAAIGLRAAARWQPEQGRADGGWAPLLRTSALESAADWRGSLLLAAALLAAGVIGVEVPALLLILPGLLVLAATAVHREHARAVERSR